MLNQFPIDPAKLTGRFVDVAPSEFDGRQQERDGLPLWNVTLLVKPANARAETMVVKIAAKDQPSAPDLAECALVNPVVTYWQQGDRSGASVRADGLEVKAAASSHPDRKVPAPA